MNRISFFSPSYHSTATQAASVASIKAQTHPVHEILTVNDGDPECTALSVGLGAKLTGPVESENRGLAASCNTVLKDCTGDFLAKVDSDVELAPDWLAKCMAIFDRQPGVAGIGGRLCEFNASTIANQWRIKWMKQHWGPEIIFNPLFLFGADCIFRVEALKAVGGWDEQYKTNYEDVDLCHRLYSHGYSLVYDPSALCRHLRSDDLAGVLTNWWRWYKAEADAIAPVGSKERKQHWRQKCLAQMHSAIAMGDFHLTYPSVILYFYCNGLDISQGGEWPASMPEPICWERDWPWPGDLTADLRYHLKTGGMALEAECKGHS